ncbi:MAG: DUF5615 family PIN-like protein [Marinoscillum sp.]
MKLLLDENLPKKLKNDLTDFEVLTVQDMEWHGKKNGELLELMISDGFNALITADKNLKNQQNFKKYPIPVLTLNVKLLTYQHMVNLLPELKKTTERTTSKRTNDNLGVK